MYGTEGLGTRLVCHSDPVSVEENIVPCSVSYKILRWGGKQDSSMTIVTFEMCLCLLRGSEGMPPPLQEIFEFTSSQIASDTVWDKISKHFDDIYLCSVICKYSGTPL